MTSINQINNKIVWNNSNNNDDDNDEPPPMEELPETSGTIDLLQTVSISTKEEEKIEQQHQQETIINAEQEKEQQNEEVIEVVEPQCVYQKHVPMLGRTNDIGLLEMDIAVQEFQQGVAVARQGNFSRAQELIGSAFLRNEYSIQHVETLPSALLCDEYDDASIHVMEHALFLRLLDHPHAELTVFLVMQMCAGAVFAGSVRGSNILDNESKRRLNIAIKSGEKLIQMYDKYWTDDISDANCIDNNNNNKKDKINNGKETDSKSNDSSNNDSTATTISTKNNNNSNNNSNLITISSPRNLFGILKRWRIHRHQSALQSVVGNFLLAYTELDAAVQTCPKTEIQHYCQVRYDLAALCMGCQLKPENECFYLFYQVVYDAVVMNTLYDTKCLPSCYAFMAMIAAKSPAAIPPALMLTSIDAFMFMEESDRCQVRYEELHCYHDNNTNNYGSNGNNNPRSNVVLDPISINRLKVKMEFLKLISNRQHMLVWKAFDKQRRTGMGTNPWTLKRRSRCLVCHGHSKSSSSSMTCNTVNYDQQKETSILNNNNSSNDDTKLSKCTRCKNAFYCSRECQKLDWAIHKGYCKQMLNSTALAAAAAKTITTGSTTLNTTT